ncbi:MAG: hypothetical protein P4L33_02950 [Capsulimonadaceae bacterium]|nr:hypothetical protein [Capsulimonadaceae bacterium]
MAQAAEIPRPYTNLNTYLAYKTAGVETLKANVAEIQALAEDDTQVAGSADEDE